MSRWRNKAVENLLKYSLEKKDHIIAAKEWQFTGKVIDHFIANQTCQLCEGENLRYHFEISCKNKSVLLLVGSSCIKKFEISVFNEVGDELFGDQKDAFLKKKIREKKQEILFEQLRKLWERSTLNEREQIEYYVNSFKRNRGFTPDDLLCIFFLMEKYKVELTKELYTVSLRSQFNLQSLLRMREEDQEKILPCLSVVQKKRFSRKKEEFQEEQKKRDSDFRVNVVEDSAPSVNRAVPLPKLSENYRQHATASATIAKSRSVSQNANRPKDIFHLPEYITCSICGEYTKEWVSFNPNKCRKCIAKSNK